MMIIRIMSVSANPLSANPSSVDPGSAAAATIADGLCIDVILLWPSSLLHDAKRESESVVRILSATSNVYAVVTFVPATANSLYANCVTSAAAVLVKSQVAVNVCMVSPSPPVVQSTAPAP